MRLWLCALLLLTSPSLAGCLDTADDFDPERGDGLGFTANEEALATKHGAGIHLDAQGKHVGLDLTDALQTSQLVELSFTARRATSATIRLHWDHDERLPDGGCTFHQAYVIRPIDAEPPIRQVHHEVRFIDRVLDSRITHQNTSTSLGQDPNGEPRATMTTEHHVELEGRDRLVIVAGGQIRATLLEHPEDGEEPDLEPTPLNQVDVVSEGSLVWEDATTRPLRCGAHGLAGDERGTGFETTSLRGAGAGASRATVATHSSLTTQTAWTVIYENPERHEDDLILLETPRREVGLGGFATISGPGPMINPKTYATSTQQSGTIKLDIVTSLADHGPYWFIADTYVPALDPDL